MTQLCLDFFVWLKGRQIWILWFDKIAGRPLSHILVLRSASFRGRLKKSLYFRLKVGHRIS